eukprot:GFUD01037330.1.p1 GENE.GFUD01037330.1~~GFUD01037330.1.p1  ORF type:complete len:232 (-),score=65.00 GFUD01037330.1:158-853(-)
MFNVSYLNKAVVSRGTKYIQDSKAHQKMAFSWMFGSNEATEPAPETKRGGLECAPYSLLESHPGYQVRNYPSRKWATVLHESLDHETRNNRSFMKLFGYITGANETGSKMSMTVPVSTKVTTKEEEGAVIMKEEMGFYVPSNLQDSTPSPKVDQEVKIVTRPEMVAYVRQFGGFAKENDWQEQKETLKKDLEGREDFSHIVFDMHYRQGFDAPYKFWGRKNEVFFIKKTDE